MADDRRKMSITRLYDNTTIILPITPFPKFSWEREDRSEDTLGLGEYETGSSKKLCVVDIDNIILPHPDNKYDFVFSNNPPSFYLNYLYQFWNENNNLLLKYYAPDYKIISLNCRSKRIGRAGEKNGNKNIYIESLKFKEYKDNKLSSMQLDTASQKAIKSYGSSTYTVKEGDNLINIAKRIYGDSSKWEILMNKNGLSNPLAIKVGMNLYI